MLAMTLGPPYKGLGLVIQYVGKNKVLWIKHNRQVLFLFIFYGYKFLNPTKVDEKALNFTSQTIESTKLYDFMETNENVALLIVKDPFRMWRFTKEECQDP